CPRVRVGNADRGDLRRPPRVGGGFRLRLPERVSDVHGHPLVLLEVLRADLPDDLAALDAAALPRGPAHGSLLEKADAAGVHEPDRDRRPGDAPRVDGRDPGAREERRPVAWTSPKSS